MSEHEAINAAWPRSMIDYAAEKRRGEAVVRFDFITGEKRLQPPDWPLVRSAADEAREAQRRAIEQQMEKQAQRAAWWRFW